MNTRRFLIAVLLLSSLLVPSVAVAQSPDADRTNARDFAVEGYKALQSGDYAFALDRFIRANVLYHAPAITLGLARAQAGLGRLVSAQDLYTRAAREVLPPSASTASKNAVHDAQIELDAISLRVPSVVIRVRGSSTARVMLDGIEVSAAALGMKQPVDPGRHVVTVSAPGFAPGEVKVALVEGMSEMVTLELEPRRAEPPPGETGVPAAEPPTLPPGVTPTPEIPAPSKPEPEQLKPKGATQKTLSLVALGTGFTSLAVGGVAGGLALSKHGAISRSCPDGHCPPDRRASLQSEIDSYSTLGTLSTIGFVTAVALTGTGVVLLLTAPKTNPSQPAITPSLGFGFIGAKGTF